MEVGNIIEADSLSGIYDAVKKAMPDHLVLVQSGCYWEARGEDQVHGLSGCRNFINKDQKTGEEELRSGVSKYGKAITNGRYGSSSINAESYIILNHLPKENGKIRRVVDKIETGAPFEKDTSEPTVKSKKMEEPEESPGQRLARAILNHDFSE